MATSNRIAEIAAAVGEPARAAMLAALMDGRALELMMMAMAADWYEGTSLTRKGQPRPPLCHIAEE